MDVGTAIIIFGIIQGVALAFLAVFEFMQVYAIRKWLVDLIKPGERPAQMIAEAAVDFMKLIQENKNGEAEVLFGFVATSARVAWANIKKDIPMLGGGGGIDTNEMLERVAKKSPVGGLILAGLQVAAPIIQAKMAEAQANQGQASPKKPGTGGRAYG